MKSWFFLLFCLHMIQAQKINDPKKIFNDDHTMFIAHRGLTGVHLENTLEALTSAFLHGADGVEFDVQLSQDMVPMVFHDRGLGRLAHINANIDDLSSDRLGALQQWGKDHDQRYPISTLQEVLSVMPHHKMINIELKETTGMKGFLGVKSVLSVIEPYKNKLSIVISSFEPMILQMVSKIDPDYAIGLLVDKEQMLSSFFEGHLYMDRVDFINPHIALVNKKISKKLKERGVKLILWGHTKMGQELDFIADSHTALISDIPLELIKHYRPQLLRQ